MNFKNWLVPKDAWVLLLSEYHFLFHNTQYTENPQFLNTYNKTHTPMLVFHGMKPVIQKHCLNQMLCQRIFCTASQRMSKHSQKNVRDKWKEIFLFCLIFFYSSVGKCKNFKFQFPSSSMELQEKKGIKKNPIIFQK